MLLATMQATDCTGPYIAVRDSALSQQEDVATSMYETLMSTKLFLESGG